MIMEFFDCCVQDRGIVVMLGLQVQRFQKQRSGDPARLVYHHDDLFDRAYVLQEGAMALSVSYVGSWKLWMNALNLTLSTMSSRAIVRPAPLLEARSDNSQTSLSYYRQGVVY